MEEVVKVGTTFFQKARSVGRITKILEPSGMERGNCEDTLAACEYEPLKSEKETSSRLSDDVKIAVLMKKTAGTSPA